MFVLIVLLVTGRHWAPSAVFRVPLGSILLGEPPATTAQSVSIRRDPERSDAVPVQQASTQAQAQARVGAVVVRRVRALGWVPVDAIPVPLGDTRQEAPLVWCVRRDRVPTRGPPAARRVQRASIPPEGLRAPTVRLAVVLPLVLEVALPVFRASTLLEAVLATVVLLIYGRRPGL